MPSLTCARRSRRSRPGRILGHRSVAPLLGLALVLVSGAAASLDLVLSGMTYVGSQAGEPALLLRAARARIPHGSDHAHLEDVHLDAAGDGGGSSLVMTCDVLDLDLTTNDFTATGRVRGRTADGHRFETDVAVFDHAAHVIEGRSNVDITDPSGTRLQGEGFRYEVRTQRMRMRNAVVTDVREEPER